MRKARWIKGDKIITGEWEYIWQSDRFIIRLDSRDPITGQYRSFCVCGDEPE
jgi:hypothetical protein